MSLYKDLFRYKRVKFYDSMKSIKDEKKYLGLDYENNLIQNFVSSHILRNQTVNEFLSFCTDYFYNTVKQVRIMKNWKNYTSKKYDKNIR